MCMCMLTKRTNILFDEKLWETLTQLAQEKKTSVGKLVRKAVEETYATPIELEPRRKAVAKILQLKEKYRRTPKKKKESIVALVRRMREERTQHLWNLLEKKSQ